jgi:serine/threonine protein kinase
MPFDLESWKQWEGHSADGVFPLERWTAEGSHGAVFETRFQGGPAMIEIVPGTPASIEAVLKLWEKTATLSHPALVRILARGETTLGDMKCAYAVMEGADENLAEVLTERFLTPAETREMLLPLLGALRYLHTNGFAHGGLKPAAIMAFGEQLKISSAGLVSGGDPAADYRAIGVLLQAVLGADQTGELPKPFAGIAKSCLAEDAAARWDLAQIESYLRGEAAPAPPGGRRVIWWGLAAAAAVILGLIWFWPSQTRSPKQSVAPAPAAPVVDNRPSPLAAPAKAPKKPATKAPPTGQRVATLDGIIQVLPDIPQAARDTITGRVGINVRVRVDAAGKVSQATLEPPPASKYFTDRVLDAARAWKFPAGGAPQDWRLRFELGREQTRVAVAKIAN